ncbi:MAG: flagellar type III secretion system protein FlhB [Gemmobacter sp.]|jgi:flagellar biosynthetic protein FlhB|nr:flagellar type III secretion system protein FlhB [Gemmobacter sp.]
MSREDSGEKSHEPTQKRLEDLRREGRAARSQDLMAAAAQGGLILAIAGPGLWSLERAGQAMAGLLAEVDRMAPLMTRGARPVVAEVLLPVLGAALPFFLLPLLAVLALITVQRGWLLTPSNLAPKLSRVSILANMGKKFGRQGLVGFAKSVAKLALVAAILGYFLTGRLDRIIGALYLSPLAGIGVLLRMLADFLLVVLLVSVVMGGADYLWQVFEHLRSARMSREELKEEQRDSEGDPHAKSARRQRGQEIAMNRMLADVPKAAVVVVNPTHYAVALAWDRKSGRAPVCLARGVDEIAAHIRERAMAAGVPIHSDPPTARALHAALRVGEEIPRDHYGAVAAAIRFAEAMRQKARGSR